MRSCRFLRRGGTAGLLLAAVLLAGCAGSSAGARPDAAAPPADAAREAPAAADAAVPGDVAPGDVAPSDAAPGDGTPGDAATAVRQGRLVGGTGDWPGGIGGVRYRSGAQSGFTDATGAFSYELGSPVTFGVADVDFRATPGADWLSPYQLAATGACVESAELERLLVLLQSLDADGDPATGTQIDHFPAGTTARQLSALTGADVATLIGQLIPGRSPVATADAVNAFITQIDGELWAQIGMDTFDTTDSAQRSQGVTTDGTYWYFSWRLGLQKTDLGYNVIEKNALAIPALLAATEGSDHIGDIDYYNGTLYVPIEDSSSYTHPNIVKFDLDLNAGQVYPVDNTLMTAGVPWVCVDGPRASVYIAQWDPTPAIYVLALGDLTYVRSIPLSVTLGRIQGAKVFEGAFYASDDNAVKSIYKINLETGTVIDLFDMNHGNEEEGLAFLALPDGSLMHTQNATASATAIEFRHHQRTREPLRKRVCP
jgi:hypothetical protein